MLRGPWGASVTVWEATAPVKLPTCHCSSNRSGHRLGRNSIKGGIPPSAPPRLAPRLRSLPPILYMREPHPMTGYSKAPRGLSVQLRVVGVFTHTTTSPSPWSRQRSSRYTIRAGRNFARSSVTRGRRLYLYLGASEIPASCGTHRFGQQPASATPGATWSRYRAAVRGFPRYYPRPACTVVGLHRYEPV